MTDEEKLQIAKEALLRAYVHCEAIALSSLLPRYSMGEDAEEFYKSQATKSVGSGGRAYWIIKEALEKLGVDLNDHPI